MHKIIWQVYHVKSGATVYTAFAHASALKRVNKLNAASDEMHDIRSTPNMFGVEYASTHAA